MNTVIYYKKLSITLGIPPLMFILFLKCLYIISKSKFKNFWMGHRQNSESLIRYKNANDKKTHVNSEMDQKLTGQTPELYQRIFCYQLNITTCTCIFYQEIFIRD